MGKWYPATERYPTPFLTHPPPPLHTEVNLGTCYAFNRRQFKKKRNTKTRYNFWDWFYNICTFIDDSFGLNRGNLRHFRDQKWGSLEA